MEPSDVPPSAVPAPDDSPGRRAAAVFAAVAGGIGFVVGWLATTPRALVHINWDAGAYLHGLATGELGWSSPPWNAHFALHYVYLLGGWIARAFGGTWTDGLRLVGATCLALITAAQADAARRLTRSRLVGGLLTATWGTAFVTVFLVFTVEDNLAFLVPASGLLWLCATRADSWGARESAAAGLLAAAAALLSVQGILYLLPALWLAGVLRAGSVGDRARDLAITAAAFALGMGGFVLFIAATSSQELPALLRLLLSKPEPSQFPTSRDELVALLVDWRGSLRTVGLATSFHLFRNRIPVSQPELLGGAALGLQVAAWIAATVWSIRRRRWAPHLLASTLLGLTALTALYRDVEYAYLKRTDFVPLVGMLLLAAAVGAWAFTPRRQRIAAVALSLVIVWQLGTALGWRQVEATTYATLDNTVLGRPLPGYHGTPDGSHLRRLRAIRNQHGRACAHVFDFSELVHGRWNPDITGVLWAELPKHQVLASPADMAGWPRKLRALSPHRARSELGACAWLSDGARQRLGGR